jgi:hypothetical protein
MLLLGEYRLDQKFFYPQKSGRGAEAMTMRTVVVAFCVGVVAIGLADADASSMHITVRPWLAPNAALFKLGFFALERRRSAR